MKRFQANLTAAAFSLMLMLSEAPSVMDMHENCTFF